MKTVSVGALAVVGGIALAALGVVVIMVVHDLLRREDDLGGYP